MSSTATLADNRVGAWSPLAPWPLVAIHASLLPDGRVLTYGTTRAGQPTGRFVYDVWDPAAGLPGGHTTLPNTTATDIFCNAQIVLPASGDVFMAGGDTWNGSVATNLGNRDTVVFRTSGNRLEAGRRMSRPRWYATLTTLMDGSVYVQGGRGDDPDRLEANSDRPERRNPDGTMTLLRDADTMAFDWYYPRNWLAPDGRIFGYADRSMYYVDPRGTGMVSGVGRLPAGGPDSYTSTEAMIAPGRILRVGGGRNYAAGTTMAYVIDINRPVPRVEPVANTPRGLHWANMTVLADGRVAVIGGSRAGNQLIGVNDTPLIWDPATGRWTIGAATTSGRARLYHATSLLLPDASVLVAGGGAVGPQTNMNAEIWYPPYLFDSTGARAPRPRITSAPGNVAAGATIAVQVSSSRPIRRVSLVRTGAVTHSFNMDQRFLPLTFTASGNSLRVQLPASPAVLPGGRYMLFAIDDAGVPSVAQLLSVRVPDQPVARVDWTPAFGTGIDGTPFTRSCPAGTVLVGLQGATGQRISSIAPVCVAVNAAGRWVAQPEARRGVGPGGGSAFLRTCPRDTAVTGLRGRSGVDVSRVVLQCRGLGRDGRTQGSVSWVEPLGSPGGVPRRAYSCGTGNPAFGIYGREADGIRSLGLRCRRVDAPGS